MHRDKRFAQLYIIDAAVMLVLFLLDQYTKHLAIRHLKGNPAVPLIDGVLEGRFGGVGLDVYEEEEGVFYEDRSGDIIADDNLARLMTLPNVLVTSHMGFFTREAMQAIAHTTLENAYALENGLPLVNQVGKEMAL